MVSLVWSSFNLPSNTSNGQGDKSQNLWKQTDTIVREIYAYFYT